MKNTWIFFSVGIISLMVLFSVTRPTMASCNEVINLEDINSYEVYDYINNNDLNITYICSNSFCIKLDNIDLEKEIRNFQDSYYEYIKEKTDNETYQSLYLKGFKITSIRVNNC